MKGIEPVFVFGSNEAGRHGKGAARAAYKQHGARWGCGIGEWGNSYAIPTKDRYIKTLPLAIIREYVRGFLGHAAVNAGKTYKVTPIGCGLAGYTPEQIGPMFEGAPANVILPPEFVRAISSSTEGV